MSGFAIKPAALGLLLFLLMAQSACLITHSGPRSHSATASFYNYQQVKKTAPVLPGQLTPKRIQSISLGESGEGRPIESYCFGEGENKKTAILLGGIHGDAPGGETLLESLVEQLSANPSHAGAWQVLIIPACNPDGLEHETRTNARGVDLNQNFPSADWDSFSDPQQRGETPGSEPEIEALLKVFAQHTPDLVCSIQSDAGCIDYQNEEAAQVALGLSEACRMPVKERAAEPGSLAAYLGKDQGIPFITMELDYFHKRRIMAPHEKERMTGALLSLFQAPRAIQLEIQPADNQQVEIQHLGVQKPEVDNFREGR